ncbi:hypothetical protein CF326_g6859, partial [Tilletia indica]
MVLERQVPQGTWTDSNPDGKTNYTDGRTDGDRPRARGQGPQNSGAGSGLIHYAKSRDYKHNHTAQ